MNYRLFLKDKDAAVIVEGDEIKMLPGGDLVVEKASQTIAQFRNGYWVGWTEQQGSEEEPASPFPL